MWISRRCLLTAFLLCCLGLSPGRADDSRGLDEMSTRVPKNAGVFLALDLRGQLDLQAVVQNAAGKLSPQLRLELSEVEGSLGVKLEEILDCLQPAGFGAVLPGAGQPNLWGDPAVRSSRPDTRLTSCTTNLRNLGTALEMYSSDNQGHYPPTLALLTPNYLKRIPACPSAKAETYSQSYQAASAPDAFTVFCQGHHHRQEAVNHPQYISTVGVISTYRRPDLPPTPGPEVVFGTPVTDERTARDLLNRLFKQPRSLIPPEGSGVGEVQCWGTHHLSLTLRDGYLLGASSDGALIALLASFCGQAPNLGADEHFAAMRKKFSHGRGGMLFVPARGLAEVLPSSLETGPEKLGDLMQGIRGFQYLSASLQYQEGSFTATAYLALDRHNKSALLQRLLLPPASPFLTPGLVPSTWSNLQVVNLHYVVDVLLEVARLIPEAGNEVDQALAEAGQQLKMDLSKDLWSTFTGEVAFSSNAPKKLPETLRVGFQETREQGRRVACTSNLKNIATALEMYGTDSAGRYPLQMSQLVPNYLRQMPTCPSANSDTYSRTYQVGVNPDAYTFLCQGQHHGPVDQVYSSYLGITRPEAPAELPKRVPTWCTSNLKNLGTALEMYSTDNAGHYPKKLSQLTPNYFRVIPMCGKARKDTYSHSFKSSQNPDRYTLMCEGKHHGQANYPRYSSEKGLVAGNTTDPAPAPAPAERKLAWDRAPTVVVALGLQDDRKVREILMDHDGPLRGLGLKSLKPEGSGVPLYGSEEGVVPIYLCITDKPVQMLVIGLGQEARQMVNEAVTVPSATRTPANYRAAWKEPPQSWISQGYVDLSGTMQAVRLMLANSPDPKLRSLLDFLPQDATTSYFLGSDGDGLVGEARGNGVLAASQLMAGLAVVIPNFIRARAMGRRTACSSNLKNMGTALEMYATDNAGYYPPDLKTLTPNYLKTIPICPGAEKDSYSDGYEAVNLPDNFNYTVYCRGNHHSNAGLSENSPQYTSREGLVTTPRRR